MPAWCRSRHFIAGRVMASPRRLHKPRRDPGFGAGSELAAADRERLAAADMYWSAAAAAVAGIAPAAADRVQPAAADKALPAEDSSPAGRERFADRARPAAAGMTRP